jgi:hypothetical protein
LDPWFFHIALTNMLTFQNISYEIDKHFPIFKSLIDPQVYTDEDRDKVYVYVNQFSKFFISKINNTGEQSKLVMEVLNFLNNEYNSSTDKEALSVIRIIFFDKLKEDPLLEEITKNYFTNRALRDFLEF